VVTVCVQSCQQQEGIRANCTRRLAANRAKAAEVLKRAQQLDDTEHQMMPFIEKFRSIKEAVAKFGRFVELCAIAKP